MKWIDYFRKFDPNVTDEQVDYILWNETCYPFDDEVTMKQIEEFYENNPINVHTKG